MRQNRASLLASFVVSVAALSCVANAGEDVSPATVGALKRSVVPVLCLGPDKKPIELLGTGFFVNRRGYFVTAGHVVFGGAQYSAQHGNCLPAIYVPFGGWNPSEALSVKEYGFGKCDVDAVNDVALCRANPNPFDDRRVNSTIQPVSFDVAPQDDGTAVAFTGFPLRNKRPVTAKGFVSTSSFHGAVPDEVSIDRGAWPGASGSPLYLSNGRVIGIMTKSGNGITAGLSFARSAAAIVHFLRVFGQ
jgi:S1-C subfamily serine protease